jgi:hypothetical protein
MRRILAIARLTWKSAFRYRLFWVMAALLAAAVVGLPLVLKEDRIRNGVTEGGGTAEGLAQILLTYTLSAITVLLGIATLWLSCGTLARDVEDCQMQLVCTKPIARWQIWLGKWLGILALNAMLLALSGAAVYMLLQWRAQRLPAAQQAKLRSEIFVARAAAKEKPADITARAKELAAAWRTNHPDVDLSLEDSQLLSNQLLAQARSEVEEVPYLYRKSWQINLSSLSPRERSQPMQLRVKFHVADLNPAATYRIIWWIGPPGSPNPQVLDEILPPDSFQEIDVRPLLDANGILTVVCGNYNNTSLFFPMEDGFEVLYRESTFGVNFVRGLAVVLCWLALLSAVGLASASFLSFPVAAFCSLAVLLVGLSAGILSEVQEEKSIFGYSQEQPGALRKIVDEVTVPVFSAMLKVVNLVQSFSPVDDLSTGHSITWGQLARAVGQIVLLMGGIFGLAGILLFNRRELAAVQPNS